MLAKYFFFFCNSCFKSVNSHLKSYFIVVEKHKFENLLFNIFITVANLNIKHIKNTLANEERKKKKCRHNFYV